MILLASQLKVIVICHRVLMGRRQEEGIILAEMTNLVTKTSSSAILMCVFLCRGIQSYDLMIFLYVRVVYFIFSAIELQSEHGQF